MPHVRGQLATDAVHEKVAVLGARDAPRVACTERLAPRSEAIAMGKYVGVLILPLEAPAPPLRRARSCWTRFRAARSFLPSAEKQGESGKFEGERAILLVETGNLGALIGSQVLRGADSRGIASSFKMAWVCSGKSIDSIGGNREFGRSDWLLGLERR